MIRNQSNSFRRSGVPVEKKSKNFNQNQKLKKIQLVSFFFGTHSNNDEGKKYKIGSYCQCVSVCAIMLPWFSAGLMMIIFDVVCDGFRLDDYDDDNNIGSYNIKYRQRPFLPIESSSFFLCQKQQQQQ